MKKIAVMLACAFLLAGMAAACPALAKTTFVSIGTGSTTGVYFPTGNAIAKLVNAKKKAYGLKVSVQSTGGSVFNVNAIMNGDLDFGVVQSDRQFEAVNGLAEWAKKGKQTDLRAVFSIHPETFFLVASKKSGIKTYSDLKGKVAAVGNPGSGQLQNAKDALAAHGLKIKDLARAEGLKAAESAQMLQDGRIDAFVYTVGNPAGLIKEATSGREEVRFVACSPAALAMLTKNHPYYVKALIPVSYYPKAMNKKDAPTFAVKATLVTRANVPDNVVYAITKEVFENLDQFKKLHQAFALLTKKEMLTGLSAPLHPGALKYYKEAGLIK